MVFYSVKRISDKSLGKEGKDPIRKELGRESTNITQIKFEKGK